MAKNSVFGKTNVTNTNNPVPNAGGDNHIDIKGSAVNWTAVADEQFVDVYDPGQDQSLISSADQTYRVLAKQHSLVQGEIVIESEKNRIYFKAASYIKLEVGKSQLIMTSDGTIELTGVQIALTGDFILSQATQNHTIKGGRVDINP